MDDRTLIERCGRGDELAWEALVRRYQARVFGLALHYMRRQEEARDMAQEIFIRLYERLDTYRGGDRFLPWLLRLARNACIDRLRMIGSRPPASDVPVEGDDVLRSGAPSPEEAAGEAARRRLLYRALDELSEPNREMILLKDIQGLRLEEIADLLGMPLGTVKSRSSRARLELAATVRRLDPSYGA